MRRTRNTLYLSAARFLGLAVSFLGFPLILRTMGKDGWGVCAMLLALSLIVSLADLGLIEGLNRMLVARIGREDIEEAKNIRCTLERALLITGAVQIGVFVVVALIRGHSVLLYALAGVTIAMRAVMNSLTNWFAAQHNFRPVAIANAINNLLCAIGGLAMVLLFKTPSALVTAWILAALCSVLYTRFCLARGGYLGGTWSPEFIKEAWLFARTVIFVRISVAFALGSDRLAIQHKLGDAPLGAYASGCRLPESFGEVLPLVQIMGPEFIQAFERGKEEFKASVNHNLRMGLLVSLCVIGIPSSFGLLFSHAWLGSNYTPEIGWVMVIMGAYYAVGVYTSFTSLAMMAAGKPQNVLPWTVSNAVVTVVASPLIAPHYGIVGVALMNATIFALQFIPLTWVTLRLVMDPPEARRTLGVLCGILLIGLAGIGCGIGSSLWLEQKGWTWGFLLAAPLVMALTISAVVGFGLAPMPHLFSRLKSLGRKV